ncbi:MAG: rhodanese-like domain-containing protein [Sphingobacteriia bacterium]|jgi:rhodanese-related sulfurtransferase|nr:rhodanese-like domain-containing protein [Sphingobacteriia bacterium]
MLDISIHELKERIDAGTAPMLIDVREPHEYEAYHLDAQLIPLGTLPARAEELSEFKDKEIVMYCRSGGRSGQAQQYLTSLGFSAVRNLTGGMLAWTAAFDPQKSI